jgi:hypothetical protein
MPIHGPLSFFLALLLTAICFGGLIANTQPEAVPIRRWDEVRSNPRLHLHFVQVDLRDPSVAVRVFRSGNDPDGAEPWETTLATVRTVAEREHLDVAVNGNFFMTKDSIALFGRRTPYFPGNWARVVGWAMSDGVLWANEPASASLIVDGSGKIHISRYDRIPENTKQIVSGSQLLVAEGRNIAAGTDLGPRTAVGINKDGTTLTLLVIDGRRPAYSAGMTFPQLADEMIRLGCSEALNLDGGGSSTLAVRDQSTGQIKIANRPSDGHDLPIPMSVERPVAAVLGIVCTTQPSER